MPGGAEHMDGSVGEGMETVRDPQKPHSENRRVSR